MEPEPPADGIDERERRLLGELASLTGRIPPAAAGDDPLDAAVQDRQPAPAAEEEPTP